MKRAVSILLILSLIISQFSFFVPIVNAASSPWAQSDWSTGSYASKDSNVVASTPNQLTLSTTEKLSNTGFETDLTSWNTALYTLNDQFTTDRAAGAVHNTQAEPTGGIRTVVDTGSKLSIASSQLTFAAGSAWGDPRLVYPAITRASGKLLITDITPADNNTYGFVGLSNTSNPNQTPAGTQSDGSIYFGDAGKIYGTMLSSTIIPVIASYTATAYKTAIVMRSTGVYYFIKGGTFTNWTLLYQTSVGSAATLYPVLMNYNLIFTADNIRIPTATWLPTPLAYDTFTRADGAIGSSETTGPDSQTTPSLAWTGSTATIATNKVVITPTLGSELWDAPAAAFTTGTYGWVPAGTNTIANVANALEITYVNSYSGATNNLNNATDLSSDLTVGGWYGLTADTKVNAGSSVLLKVSNGIDYDYLSSPITSTTFVNTPISFRTKTTASSQLYLGLLDSGEVFTIDNLSLKPLTLSSLFSSVSTSDTDVIADANVTLTAGTQAGLVTNLDSTSSPANFLIAYHDGTNVLLDKNVAGTYTNLISAAATYSAGATLRVITYHSDANTLKVRVYYNNVMIGTEQTVTDAGIISNTKHGLFSTYASNTFDNFTLWARGSDGEYAVPDTDLTATRDTGTKYAGTASVKLVAPSGNDANYTQNVNVGDTNPYTLSAYAYTDGSAVTASDLSLYNDTGTIATTYTPAGGGWYQLTGTVTGVASSKAYGVMAKAGKTVYVDNTSLNNYTSGTLTSSIFDAGYTATWGTLTYSATTPSGTSVSVKVRTGNSSDLSDATAFTPCTAISSGSSISANACASGAKRYAQYLITLTSTTGVSTPTFSSFSAAFSDTVAPSTGSISINSGATYSTSRSVTLTLSATDNQDSGSSLSMMISNDSGFSGGAWETYATSKSWTLASGDGTQTVYVKYKDSSGNTGSTYSDTIILDTTAPTAPTLTSPSDGTYTNNTSPTFTFSGGSTDATSGFDHYAGSMSKNSCSSGTCSYSFGTVTPNTNITIGSGKSLSEGVWSWNITAYDVAGNSASTTRTLYVDLSSPSLTATLDNQGLIDDYYLVNTQSPKISGTVTDNMYINGVTVSFYKEKTLLGVVFSEDLVDQETLGKPTSTTPASWDYAFTASKQLDHGKYRVTIKATDAAGNSSGTKEWEVQILPQEKINLLLLEAGEKPEKETAGPFSIPELEKKALIRRGMEAENLAALTSQITNFLGKYLGIPLTKFFGDLSERIAYFTKTVRTQLASIEIPSKFKIPIPEIPNIPYLDPIAQKSNQAAEIINKPFNSLARASNLAVKNGSRSLALGIIGAGESLARVSQNLNNSYGRAQGNVADKISSVWQGQKLSEALSLSIAAVQKPVVATTNLLGRIRMGLATAYAIIIDKQPTRITEVSIVEVGRDYAIVDFKTNHPSLGKVNYGETLSYGKNVLLNEYSLDHKAKLTGLTPGKVYFFEVMAQNKNYAYDAYYTIQIPNAE